MRYARGCVVLARGERALAEAILDQAAAASAPTGMRLFQARALITHIINEALDSRGWCIQCHARQNAGCGDQAAERTALRCGRTSPRQGL